MENNEILDTIRPGMSVELANGYRYDVVDTGYCDIILINYEDMPAPSVSLKNYNKDGRCNQYLNGHLDIVAIYKNKYSLYSYYDRFYVPCRFLHRKTHSSSQSKDGRLPAMIFVNAGQ
jgi:hypothetical protein